MNARWIAVGTEGERASLSSDVVLEYFNRINRQIPGRDLVSIQTCLSL